MGYIKGTGRLNSKKTKKQYRHESSLLNKRGRSQAITELKDPETVYILGQSPTYIHSREIYYKTGRNTAIQLLNTGLDKTVSMVQGKINQLLPYLDNEVNYIVKSLNMNSWEEFQQWWSTEVQPSSPDLATNNEALYYLSLLEKIKKQATSIGAYLQTRKSGKTSNGGDMSASSVQQLISAGFVDVSFTGKHGEQAGSNALITKIRAEQKKDLAQLAQWLLTKVNTMNDAIGEGIIRELKSIVGPNLDGLKNISTDKVYGTQIGNIYEYLSAMFERELCSGIKVEMQNVAAEKTGKNSKKFKADTNIKISLGNLQLSFLSSDKTGMSTVFAPVTGQAIGYIDKFTAGLATDTLNINNIESAVDFNLIDPRLNNLFQYIVKNADFFGRQDEEGKTLIVSFFAWAKIITELVGAESSITQMPVVIRMFNRIYRTSDIMRKFTNIYGTNIMTYINKSYLNDFYNTLKPSSKMSLEELRQIKKSAMQNLGARTTYKALKASINDTLTSLNGQITRQGYFKTNFRILLGNVENLKEFV